MNGGLFPFGLCSFTTTELQTGGAFVGVQLKIVYPCGSSGNTGFFRSANAFPQSPRMNPWVALLGALHRMVTHRAQGLHGER